MKRRLISGLLVLVMLLAVFATACSSTPAPTEVIKLKYSTSMAPVETPVIYANYLLDYLEEESNGKVEVERFVGGTLGKANEHMDLVGGGSVDFCSISLSWVRDKLPLHSYMNWILGGQEVVADLHQQLNRDIPETAQILEQENADAGIKILAFFATGENGIIAREPFNSLADLKGKKIGTSPNYRAIESMGLTTVSMAIPDIYEGLAKGVIDAQCLALAPMAALKWHEVSKCFMGDGHYSGSQFICINLDTWNSLPKDIQDILLKGSEKAEKYSIEYDKKNTEETLQIFRDAGLTVGRLPESDSQQMFELEYQFRAQDMIDLCEPKGKVDEAQIILKHLDEITGQ
jgi:TRAP-type C4-dicarboxylate transport system substrate-binding protein